MFGRDVEKNDLSECATINDLREKGTGADLIIEF